MKYKRVSTKKYTNILWLSLSSLFIWYFVTFNNFWISGIVLFCFRWKFVSREGRIPRKDESLGFSKPEGKQSKTKQNKKTNVFYAESLILLQIPVHFSKTYLTIK